MTHLLDTHAWVQRALGENLPPLVEQTLATHADTLSLADISIWEVAKLFEMGRLQLDVPLTEFFELALSPELTVFPISAGVGSKASTLESQGFHKDPADQLIVATALTHNLRLISNDARIRQWGRVPLLWRTSRG